MQRTYYEILGLPATASADDIRQRFRELARKHHPDVQRDKDMGHRAFVQISEAYHVLSDPGRRADYDLKLRDLVRRQQTASPGSARSTPGAGPGGTRPGGTSGAPPGSAPSGSGA